MLCALPGKPTQCPKLGHTSTLANESNLIAVFFLSSEKTASKSAELAKSHGLNNSYCSTNIDAAIATY